MVIFWVMAWSTHAGQQIFRFHDIMLSYHVKQVSLILLTEDHLGVFKVGLGTKATSNGCYIISQLLISNRVNKQTHTTLVARSAKTPLLSTCYVTNGACAHTHTHTNTHTLTIHYISSLNTVFTLSCQDKINFCSDIFQK